MNTGNRYSSHAAVPAEPLEWEPERPSPSNSIRRMARLLLLLGLIILLLWVGLKSWRVYRAAQSLMAVQTEARALMAGGITQVDPDAAEALALNARANIVTLRDELDFIRPFAPYLSWVPKLGPTLVAAPWLLDMADAGSEAGALAVGGLKPALTIFQREDFSATRLGEILPVLSDATPKLEAAGEAVQRYSAAQAGLDAAVETEALPWRVRQLLTLSDQWLPAAKSGLALAPHLPFLMGQDGLRRYLILAQNEDELRATGGFLTGAGLLTVKDGSIRGLDFSDANQIDNWREKPYGFPPQPLYDFMGLELFLFRDANYWPDFPTSAEKAMQLYAYGRNVPLPDGVIAIDQEFLRLLVDATGPIPILGTDQMITANNLLATLRGARDIQEGQEVGEWVNNRKAFLGGFATTILNKIETDPGSMNPVKLAGNLTGAAENRHLSIYVRDPDTARALAEVGWDGHLPQSPPGDFWMAVDTNMGYNKVNLLVERAFSYDVVLGSPSTATLTIDYRHTGQPGEKPCYQGVEEEFERADDYLSLADQCYWNYLRLYTPLGSRLLDSSRHIVPGETLFSGETWDSSAQTTDDLPWLTTFANFFLVPRGESLTAWFRYELPTGIVESDGRDSVYRLAIHKQPGTRIEPLRLSISLPHGASLVEAHPSPTEVEGGRLFFDTELDADMEIVVRYR